MFDREQIIIDFLKTKFPDFEKYLIAKETEYYKNLNGKPKPKRLDITPISIELEE